MLSEDGVKLVDFGLARAHELDEAGGDSETSPTITAANDPSVGDPRHRRLHDGYGGYLPQTGAARARGWFDESGSHSWILPFQSRYRPRVVVPTRNRAGGIGPTIRLHAPSSPE